MQLLQFQPQKRAGVAPGGDDTIIQSAQAEATAELRGSRPTSAGMLLTNHILQDGELVLLVLKPSVWFILLSSLWFIGGALIVMLTALVYHEQIPGQRIQYVELAIFLIAGRIMWGVLVWMGRLYILTDMRIVRLSGVFNINIYDCPLRKVARARVVRSMRERLLRLGTIEITPADADCMPGAWQTIAQPRLVHEQIMAAINRSRQGRGSAVAAR